MNLLAAGVESLGEFMGVVGRDASKLIHAYDATQTRVIHLATARSSIFVKDVKDEDSTTSVLDLPLCEATQSRATHLFDIVRGFEGDLDLDKIKPLMKAKAFDQLPIPLRPKKAAILDGVACQMQVNIHKNAEGTLDILKWFKFEQIQVLHRVKRLFVPWRSLPALLGSVCAQCCSEGYALLVRTASRNEPSVSRLG
jgi:hypothetical protein